MTHQPPAPLRVSAVQCRIHWNDVTANLLLIEQLVREHAATSDLIVFPETITTGFSSEAAKLADQEQGEVYQYLQQLSAKYKVALAGSYLSILADNIHNVFFLIEPSGRVQLQPKRHLFAPGGEKEFVHPATDRTIFTLYSWRILPIICYDLRFPVWCRNVSNEYDLIIAVANWPRPRRDVFRTLLRARAMENLCYVVGVNRIGEDGNRLIYSGDSAIIDPRGKILLEAQEETEEVITTTLDYTPLQELRRKFPVWADADSFLLQI